MTDPLGSFEFPGEPGLSYAIALQQRDVNKKQLVLYRFPNRTTGGTYEVPTIDIEVAKAH